jgi:hypothetical protein
MSPIGERLQGLMPPEVSRAGELSGAAVAGSIYTNILRTISELLIEEGIKYLRDNRQDIINGALEVYDSVAGSLPDSIQASVRTGLERVLNLLFDTLVGLA